MNELFAGITETQWYQVSFFVIWLGMFIWTILKEQKKENPMIFHKGIILIAAGIIGLAILGAPY